MRGVYVFVLVWLPMWSIVTLLRCSVMFHKFLSFIPSSQSRNVAEVHCVRAFVTLDVVSLLLWCVLYSGVHHPLLLVVKIT